MKLDEKRCPKCAETIKLAAAVCRYCGHEFTQQELRTSQQNNGAAGCLGVIVLALLVGMCTQLGKNDPSSTSTTPSQTAMSQAAEDAEKREQGFHCLSSWDGSHRALVAEIKSQLRDPDSFKHVDTRITPKDDAGNHTLIMEYRAKNGFGGMNVGQALATVRNADCSFRIVANQSQ